MEIPGHLSGNQEFAYRKQAILKRAVVEKVAVSIAWRSHFRNDERIVGVLSRGKPKALQKVEAGLAHFFFALRCGRR
jgi:hypothetical protein